ncbi:hypothetical protein VDG1235_1675 [Verrucomicrobiia bacterium DG1235]|nr:hypothetical protein VDG1235_1675 [Verrucomicrobiae bacterium DG1235]
MVGLMFVRSASIAGELVEFSSGEMRAQLIELYTSQGCSSCPSAERKLSELIDHPGLWSEMVPIVFHVDYWDSLGWRDPFASAENTKRQYKQREEGNLGSVYTPAFIVDGSEWRGYFKGADWPSQKGTAGVLEERIQDRGLEVEYGEAAKGDQLNVAVVGVGLMTRIKRGENRNKTLRQDFVSLWHENSSGAWTVELPMKDELGLAERYAVVVWVTRSGSLKPVQATGAWWAPE